MSDQVPSPPGVPPLGAEYPPAGDEPYPSGSVAAAAVLSFFAPFISLVIALGLRSSEKGTARRSQLSSWALASGIWLAVGGIIVIAAFSSMVGHATPTACRGGIDRLEPPSYVSTDGHHWTAVYTCFNGGTLRRPAHAAWLNR